MTHLNLPQGLIHEMQQYRCQEAAINGIITQL